MGTVEKEQQFKGRSCFQFRRPQHFSRRGPGQLLTAFESFLYLEWVVFFQWIWYYLMNDLNEWILRYTFLIKWTISSVGIFHRYQSSPLWPFIVSTLVIPFVELIWGYPLLVSYHPHYVHLLFLTFPYINYLRLWGDIHVSLKKSSTAHLHMHWNHSENYLNSVLFSKSRNLSFKCSKTN